MKKLLLLVVALMALTSAVGCMYNAVWDAKNNKMFVAKNSMLYGIGSSMMECKPTADSWNCVESPDAP